MILLNLMFQNINFIKNYKMGIEIGLFQINFLLSVLQWIRENHMIIAHLLLNFTLKFSNS